MGSKNSRTGMSGHRLNKTWRDVRQRCNNPNNQAYKDYGAKGVKVCKEWGRFDAFLSWALENGYEEGLTLDRKDSSGHYEPNNCQWITRAENTRKAQLGRKGERGRQESYITFNGNRWTKKQWADSIGITTVALNYRLSSPYWTLEEALTFEQGKEPKGKPKEATVTFNGKTQTLSQWAKDTGIPRQILYGRIHQLNWSAEKALTKKVHKKSS